MGQSSVKNVFIRGSVVRYVHLPGAAVDTALLEDATRRGALNLCLVGGVVKLISCYDYRSYIASVEATVTPVRLRDA